jgi:hypothetical protein
MLYTIHAVAVVDSRGSLASVGIVRFLAKVQRFSSFPLNVFRSVRPSKLPELLCKPLPPCTEYYGRRLVSKRLPGWITKPPQLQERAHSNTSDRDFATLLTVCWDVCWQ